MEDSSSQNAPLDTIPVDQQRRIDLKRSVLEAVLGITLKPGETRRLWGVIGKQRQLQLLPPQSQLSQLRDRLENAVPSRIRWHESTDQKAVVHRQLARMLPIRCHRRKRGHYLQITFPADLVALGVIETDQRVVVVAIGEILEFWREDRWHDSTSIDNLYAFTEAAQRLVDDEGVGLNDTDQE